MDVNTSIVIISVGTLISIALILWAGRPPKKKQQ